LGGELRVEEIRIKFEASFLEIGSAKESIVPIKDEYRVYNVITVCLCHYLIFIKCRRFVINYIFAIPHLFPSVRFKLFYI